jgi:activator of HSP90 ATPase
MPQTIQQSVTLPAAANRLFEMYLDPRLHAAFTGAPVTINEKPGSEFTAFDEMITGRMLYTVPGHMIVQTWRSSEWHPEDIDSVLVLTFWPVGDAGRIELVHVNVADHDVEAVTQGWEKYYWKPWRSYLQEGAN